MNISKLPQFGPFDDIIDYDRIQDMITTSNEVVCECSTVSSELINQRLDAVESGIRQVIGEVTNDISEVETIVSGTGFKVVI